MRSETNLENLNNAMLELAQKDTKIVFIGEDIAIPYEGAFKAEKKLQSFFPDRVISTPICEESFTGMAAGMAVKGYKPIVDLMFSDFMTLTFDIVLNFASKYPEMYGEKKKFNMILRSANGGYRGYGPTHSQSMQKYFMGIPNVCVYEMTPFHDNKLVFERMLEEDRLCVFFEEKQLYSKKVYRDGRAGDLFSFEYIGEKKEWAHIFIEDTEPEAFIICPGGMTDICMDAAERLMMEEELAIDILIPTKLYPCELNLINSILGSKQLFIVEESTFGADWGTVLLRDMYELNEHELHNNITMLSSKDSVIPASIDLETKMLISSEAIVNSIKKLNSQS